MADTLRAAGAEDKSLLGSKLSTDSGAKTRLGFGEELSPSRTRFTGIGICAINPRGLGTESPEKRSPFFIDSLRPYRSFSDSALSSEACLRPQPLHEPIPLTGCRNHYSASLG
jgi:hypothetical protein